MKILVASLVSFSFLCIVRTQAPDLPCEKFQEFDNGVCYTYNFQQQSWADAEKHCESVGSHLVSIRDVATSEYLKGKSQSGGIAFWFGLSKNKDGDFVWSDEPHTFNAQGFTDWTGGLMNPEGNCVAMVAAITDSQPLYKMGWATTACDKTFPSVCAAPAKTPAKAP